MHVFVYIYYIGVYYSSELSTAFPFLILFLNHVHLHLVCWWWHLVANSSSSHNALRIANAPADAVRGSKTARAAAVYICCNALDGTASSHSCRHYDSKAGEVIHCVDKLKMSKIVNMAFSSSGLPNRFERVMRSVKNTMKFLQCKRGTTMCV